MSLLGNNTIEKRVMAVVRSKITAAQESYNRQCLELEEQTREQHRQLDDKLESNKEAAAQELVNQIVGKFI